LGDLPEPNKAILLDLANMLVEEGKDEFSFIVNALQNQVLDNTLFDSSADMIKYGFQIEQDYKKYTQSGHPEFLQSLVNCFILCRGQELVGLLPIIDVECLKILVRSSIDHSGNTDCSAQLLKLARQLEHIIE
jgi:hypothetical protein